MKTLKIGHSILDFDIDTGKLHAKCNSFPVSADIDNIKGVYFRAGQSIDDPVTYVIECQPHNILVTDSSKGLKDVERVTSKIGQYLCAMQSARINV